MGGTASGDCWLDWFRSRRIFCGDLDAFDSVGAASRWRTLDTHFDHLRMVAALGVDAVRKRRSIAPVLARPTGTFRSIQNTFGFDRTERSARRSLGMQTGHLVDRLLVSFVAT